MEEVGFSANYPLYSEVERDGNFHADPVLLRGRIEATRATVRATAARVMASRTSAPETMRTSNGKSVAKTPSG